MALLPYLYTGLRYKKINVHRKLKGRVNRVCPQVRGALWDIDLSPLLEKAHWDNTSTRILLTKAVKPFNAVKWADTLLSTEMKFVFTVNTWNTLKPELSEGISIVPKHEINVSNLHKLLHNSCFCLFLTLNGYLVIWYFFASIDWKKLLQSVSRQVFSALMM